MHKYEAAVLGVLKDGKSLTLDQLAERSGLKRDALLWAIESLSPQGLIKVTKAETESAELSEEAKGYAKNSLPEQALLDRLGKGTIKIAALKDEREMIGLQWLKRKGYAVIKDGVLELAPAGAKALGAGVPEDRILKELAADPGAFRKVSSGNKNSVEELVKRGLILVKKTSAVESLAITKEGMSAAAAGREEGDVIDALDKSMIARGTWQGRRFKKYDVNVPVEAADAGRLHPLRGLINEIKDIYTDLGFREMSGPIIEPAFWSFDSLFVPQDHPARTVMDTFYLSNPANLSVDKAEMRKVKKAHEKAYHEKWSEAVASQSILRTHGTSVSARYLSQITNELTANKNAYQLPVKLFGISRVFRNENIDFKHLENFYQMDGIIIGHRLTLSNLFDMLIRVYDSLGLKVRFVPAYFPFVEPGVEIQAEKDGKTLELGGAGMIRREIVGAQRRKLTVLAWGCGIERILLLRDKSLAGIPELYNNSVGWARKRPLV